MYRHRAAASRRTRADPRQRRGPAALRRSTRSTRPSHPGPATGRSPAPRDHPTRDTQADRRRAPSQAQATHTGPTLTAVDRISRRPLHNCLAAEAGGRKTCVAGRSDAAVPFARSTAHVSGDLSHRHRVMRQPPRGAGARLSRLLGCWWRRHPSAIEAAAVGAGRRGARRAAARGVPGGSGRALPKMLMAPLRAPGKHERVRRQAEPEEAM